MCDLFTDVQIRHGLTMNILGINERPLIIYGRKKGGGVVCFSEPDTLPTIVYSSRLGFLY